MRKHPRQGRRQGIYINETIDGTSLPLREGVVVEQKIITDESVYAVVLSFHTREKVLNGTVFLEIKDQANQVIAKSSVDMTQLLNDTFYGFLLDKPIEGKKGQKLSIDVFASPASEQDILCVNKLSDKQKWQNKIESQADDTSATLSNFNLYEDGKETQGIIALKLVTDRSGDFIFSFYGLVAAFLIAIVVVAVIGLYVFKLKPHQSFFVLAILLGIAYSIALPPYTAPDEAVHINTAYGYSNVMMGEKFKNAQGALMVRKGDLETADLKGEFSVFSYRWMYEGMSKQMSSEDLSLIPFSGKDARTAEDLPFFLYAPQALGVFIARVLKLNSAWLFTMGRMMNLIAYALIVAFAIKIAPIGKNILIAVGLLPMTLHLASSFSYDTMVISFAFLFIATCLYLAKGERQVKIKDMIILSAAAFFLAPSKGIYIFICGLCLIIPMGKFAEKRDYFIGQGLVFATSIASTIFYNLNQIKSYVKIAPEQLSVQAQQVAVSAPPIEGIWGGTEFYNLSYILTHLSDTIKLVLNTLQEQTAFLIQSMVGGRLGEIIFGRINISWILVVVLIVILLLSTLKTEDEMQLSQPQKAWSGVVVACVTAAMFLMCIFWTYTWLDSIWGLQGRYLLPALPLLLLIMQNRTIVVKKDISKALQLFLTVTQVFVILNIFVIIL
ncbi:MAG: DUF2142 domain-containing protein [Oscillospiraceae bacterium]